MKHKLIVLNLCYGFARPSNWYFCPQFHKVAKVINDNIGKFDSCLIINDVHNKEDREFKYLPPHCVHNSIDIAPARDFYQALSDGVKDIGNIQVVYKSTLNAFASESNFTLISD